MKQNNRAKPFPWLYHAMLQEIQEASGVKSELEITAIKCQHCRKLIPVVQFNQHVQSHTHR